MRSPLIFDFVSSSNAVDLGGASKCMNLRRGGSATIAVRDVTGVRVTTFGRVNAMRAYSPERTVIRLLGALAAFFFAVGLNPAYAVTVGPSTVLPNAVSYEYFGVNFAMNIKTSNTVGT